MKVKVGNPTKELYQQLRLLSCEDLWDDEIPLFNAASQKERMAQVALVRAVGVVFSESGTDEQKEAARVWLRGLLQDPCEKIRRYAMTALPKLGADPNDEAELLSLLEKTPVEREKKFLGKTLDKIGGAATLETIGKAGELSPQTEQKVKASIARRESPSIVRMDRPLSKPEDVRIHLRGRDGLEEIVHDEVKEHIRKARKFRIEKVSAGLVSIIPIAPFTLGDIYAMRCFGTMGFVLGRVKQANDTESVEALASVITSPIARRILKVFTEGAIRYRLDFVSKGHQRGAVRLVTNRAYALCPEILNDARNAPWSMDIHPVEEGSLVELRPRLTPDPRLYFRRDDVPAASHPPLAACMARLAGRMDHEVIWDPFCGSALELIERALLGGVRKVYGTDRDEEAIAIAKENFAAAKVKGIESKFTCCDFRDFATVEGRRPNSVTLIISNPPMGKRVPIHNLPRLIEELFAVAAEVLRPGGRLVFANPLHVRPTDSSLRLHSRQVVDFSGFDCRLEMYIKSKR